VNVRRVATAARRVPRPDRRLLFAAGWWLVRCRVALWTLPYVRTRRLVDRWSAPRRRGAVAPGRVAWAVRTAARPIPGATCLTQALAAEIMLRRDGAAPVVRFGATRAEGDFEAHAWLELDGKALVGDLGLDRYTAFSRPPAMADEITGDVVVGDDEPRVDSPEP
jgi:transglutaminase superfamily protein